MKLHVFGTSKQGEGKSLSKFYLLFLSVHCGDFIEQIKKNLSYSQRPNEFQMYIDIKKYIVTTVSSEIAGLETVP